MKALAIFIGEAFRSGGRIIGEDNSFKAQIDACGTHKNFIDILRNKHKIDCDIFVGSYNTRFNKKLLKNYKRNLIGYFFLDERIGLNNLFHKCINSVESNKYDYIFYIRIDLFLKDNFFDIFSLNNDKIVFPTICWYKDHKFKKIKCPRVNDMTLFIPKKYFKFLDDIILGHECWLYLVTKTSLCYKNFDVMINTFHDSDSFKDWNPLYYIVNRPESKEWHSKGKIFKNEGWK